MTRRLRTALAALAALAVLTGCGGNGGDAPRPAGDGLRVGIQDDRLAAPGVDPAERLDLVESLGAGLVRVDLRWDLVAARRPADARNPDDPAYDWSHYDAVVDDATALGMDVMFTIWGTPPWAADPAGEDPRFPAWGARPRDPADAGAFAEAAAQRYGPEGVHMWEAWNEPNIPLFLRPQYIRSGTTWAAASPGTYAAMLTAMYRGIKHADPSAVVAGGVTAPAGNKEPSDAASRVPPQQFLRALNDLEPPMDAYAHHPYPITPPRTRNNPRASYVDLYNLDVLERELDEGYLAGKPLWLTEFGVGTRAVSNYPFFVSPERQRDMLQDAFRRVRADRRVRVFVWYLLQDHVEWSSGLLDETGAQKPAAAAFRDAASGG
ncbi:MAG: cellulase family glycosylhydrolase [Thermoleophilia bacterium]